MMDMQAACAQNLMLGTLGYCISFRSGTQVKVMDMHTACAQNLVPGTLGGTYGGGPLACAAAVATLDVIEGENLLQNAEARGRQLVAVRIHTRMLNSKGAQEHL